MGSLAAVYSPAVFVARSRVKPFSGFETVTWAPGIAPPEESVTVPTIVAVSCAQPRAQKKKSTDAKIRLLVAIPPLPARQCPDVIPQCQSSQHQLEAFIDSFPKYPACADC